MKWLFYVIVFAYMFYRTVYGLKSTENFSVESVGYGDNDFLKAGSLITVSCKAPNRNQKVEWIDPNGRVVKRIPGSRVFTQEHFVQSMKGRSPALVLTITNAAVQDTGVYQCRSGDIIKNVSVCVIDPSEFIDTPAELVAELGRAITLSCQAKGEPEPRLLWSRNGETITDEDSSAKYRVMTKYNIQGFESLLTIISLGPKDSGVYSCESIQESAQVENCTHKEISNITLNVKYAPIFEEVNDTKLVYGRNNQKLDIICSADGYPAPTYMWYKDLGDNVLYEFDKKQIKLIEEDSQAVLTVVANQSTFGQRFKCQAKNEHGVSYMDYILLKTEKPRRPSELNLFNATEDSLLLNLTWYDDIEFPIAAFDIQYIKVQTQVHKRINPPSELAWRKSKQTEVNLDDVSTLETETGCLVVELNDLEAETNYWVRLRIKNEVGESLWSAPILASTSKDQDEITTIETTEATSTEPTTSSNDENMNNTTFYGLFFAGGIFVVSFIYMFVMRLVK